MGRSKCIRRSYHKHTLKQYKLTMGQTASEHRICNLNSAIAFLSAYPFKETKNVAKKQVDKARAVSMTLPHNTLKSRKQILKSFEVW